MPQTTTPSPGWAGWWRPTPRSRWVKLATGPTWADCWSLLLERLPAEGKGGESLVLPAHRHPDGRPGRRATRPASVTGWV